MSKESELKGRNVTAEELRDRLERRRERADTLRKERKRIRERLDDLREGNRRLVERIKDRTRPKGAEKAVKWGLSKVGVTESPAYSNRGPQIDAWTRYTGYAPPVFWCGCFVCYAVCHEGLAKISVRVRLGYHLHIVEDARAKRNGLKAVPIADAKPGDIVSFDFAHIALVAKKYDGSGYLDTVEGNTSNGAAGSQNNGGGVYRRRRGVGDVLVIARPNY